MGWATIIAGRDVKTRAAPRCALFAQKSTNGYNTNGGLTYLIFSVLKCRVRGVLL